MLFLSKKGIFFPIYSTINILRTELQKFEKCMMKLQFDIFHTCLVHLDKAMKASKTASSHGHGAVSLLQILL